MSFSSIQKSEKEIIINFPISKVKLSIMEMFKLFPTKYVFRKNDINETFNTYHFPIANKISVAIADITLEEVSEDKTKIKIVITNAVGSKSTNSILEGVSSDYLMVLSKVLSGENMQSIKKAVNNSGCLLFILISIVSLLLVSFKLLN